MKPMSLTRKLFTILFAVMFGFLAYKIEDSFTIGVFGYMVFFNSLLLMYITE